MLDPASDGTQTFSRSPAGRLFGHHDGTTGSLAGLNRHGDLAYTFGADGTLTHTATWEPYGVAIDRTGTTPTVGFQADYTDPTSGELRVRSWRCCPEQRRVRGESPGSVVARVSHQMDRVHA